MLPYVFVLGLAHSGSTLLAFLLNAHPEIHSVGETNRITELLPERWIKRIDLCSCGKTFYDCNFWNRTFAGLAARGYGVGNPDFFVYEPEEKALADAKLKALVETMLEVQKKKVLLDASKHSHLVLPLSRNPYLDLRVINLTRDGRGVINSWRRKLPDSSPEKVTRRWLRHEELRREALAHVSPGQVHHLKYETLAQTPDSALQEVCEFIGVDPQGSVKSGFKSKTVHHIIGNRMRLDQTESIKFDEKWRTELPAEWLEKFAELGGTTVNKENGYAD